MTTPPSKPHNPIDNPPHYTQHPSGKECLDITRGMGFNLGNAIKYVWRHKHKNGLEDLHKALFYLDDLTHWDAYYYGPIPTHFLYEVAATEPDPTTANFYEAIASSNLDAAIRWLTQLIDNHDR